MVLTLADQNVLNRFEKRPHGPKNAYHLFMNVKFKEGGSLRRDLKWQRNVVLQWRQLEPTERQQYEKNYNDCKASYDKEYQVYMDNLPDFRRKQELEKQQRNPKRQQNSKRRSRVQSVDDAARDIASAEENAPAGVQVKQAKKRRSRVNTEVRDDGDQETSFVDRAVKTLHSKHSSRRRRVANGRPLEPVVPPRTIELYFAKYYKGDRKVEEAFQLLTDQEMRLTYNKMVMADARYIRHFDAFLKSLSKEVSLN